jgi:hypothetical protein
MKIADINQPVSRDGRVENCTLVFFANKFEEMPLCHRVGDIIRVHRVTASEFNGVKLFTSRLYFNSSWILLRGSVEKGEGEFEPCKFFGKTFSPVDKT